VIIASIDLDGTSTEAANVVDWALSLRRTSGPTGDDYRGAMALLDGARSELAAMAHRADEAARQQASGRR